MRYLEVEANIVALSGIAIAIGTMVDLGIVMTENILKHLKNTSHPLKLSQVIYNASAEVSSAILTAIATTIVSFIPVFTMEAAEGNYAEEREVKMVLIVAYTSNRGLCGAFNSQVIKRVRKEIEASDANIDFEVFSVGKKAYDFFAKTPYVANLNGTGEEANRLYDNISFDQTAEVAEAVMQSFVEGTYDRIVLVYNKFKNAASQETMFEQLLPIVPPAEVTNDTEYIFEPSKGEILDELIPKALKTQFHKALLDSNASEHGARMTAMHKATDNASELLKELKLTYNKARQAAITTEILEITSGAEALNG